MIQCGTCTATQSFTQTIGVFEIKRCAQCGGLMEERRDRHERNRESPALETDDTGRTMVPLLDDSLLDQPGTPRERIREA
jgi:NMD protein affecting ribosome stability and mRNA decay